MPVNYQQVQQQIKEMGKKAPNFEALQQKKREQAQEIFQKYAKQLDALNERVDLAISYNTSLRCAIPGDDPLNAAFDAQPAQEKPTLLAADGSQANPNRHGRVEFGLINVGAIRMRPGLGLAPQEIVRSELLMYDDLYTPAGPVTEEIIALRRDLAERRMLAELGAVEEQPVITLTDGPLELFREPKEDQMFKTMFEEYLDEMEKLASMNVTTAGYVDKPRADLVVRLLELMLLKPEEISHAGHIRQLQGVSDADLYYNILKPGQRTAIFAIQSSSAARFKGRLNGQLALHFFYLNVGRENKPQLARVEIPNWVARQPAMVNLLQASLLQQCQQMGGKPFPYIVHRAHEVAVVTFAEKQQLETMITAELISQGIPVDDPSNKQTAKDLPGRTRYGA